MKKRLELFLMAALLLVAFSGCSAVENIDGLFSKEPSSAPASTTATLTTVTTAPETSDSGFHVPGLVPETVYREEQTTVPNTNVHRDPDTNPDSFTLVPETVPVPVETTTKEEPTTKKEEPTTKKQEPPTTEAPTREPATIQPDDDDPMTPIPKETLDRLVREVINGKWGDGAERRARLKAAGYSYRIVQSEVNRVLGYEEQAIED